MSVKVDPKKKKLLNDFITHLEKRESKNGWVIISKPSYDTNNLRKTYSKERPPNSMKQMLKVHVEWLEMGNEDLDYEIDKFLSDYE